MIEICICADDRYMMPAGVCITSIFENNKDEKVRVHLITEGISRKNKEKLEKTEEKYQQQIEIHKINADIFKDFPTPSIFSKAIYLRYLIPQIVDPSIEKILYMDCDIICVDNLHALWDIDLSDSYCGVVIDAHGDHIVIRNRLNEDKERFPWDSIYFNSGVLLFNNHLWRKFDLANKLIEFISTHKELCSVYPDQDALNVVFRDKVKFLPLRYNVQEACFLKKELIHLRTSLMKQIDDAVNSPCLIHFSCPQKPWHITCHHPLTRLFVYYRKCSLWRLSYMERIKKLPYQIRHKIRIAIIPDHIPYRF